MCHVTLTTPISGVVCHPKLVILTLTWVISFHSYHMNAHTQTHKHRQTDCRTWTTKWFVKTCRAVCSVNVSQYAGYADDIAV